MLLPIHNSCLTSGLHQVINKQIQYKEEQTGWLKQIKKKIFNAVCNLLSYYHSNTNETY
jgi:hypothetical protein